MNTSKSRVIEIAAKLGVKPVQFGAPPTLTVRGDDGNSYNVWEVIAAVLDRNDSAGTSQRPGMLFGKLPKIAARLGVKPVQFDNPSAFPAMGTDGNAYDLWEVMEAVLDRIDSSVCKELTLKTGGTVTEAP